MHRYLQLLSSAAQSWRKSVWDGDQVPVNEQGNDIEEPGKASLDLDSLKFWCTNWVKAFEAGTFSPEALRLIIVSSCSEFNRPEFFVAVQVALMLYYPGLALGMMYQYCDQDSGTAEQSSIQQSMSDTTQSAQTLTEQTMTVYETLIRFVQSMRTMAVEQGLLIQTQKQRRQPPTAAITRKGGDPMTMISSEGHGVGVEVMVKVPPHGVGGQQERRGESQRKGISQRTVWRTVYVAI